MIWFLVMQVQRQYAFDFTQLECGLSVVKGLKLFFIRQIF